MDEPTSAENGVKRRRRTNSTCSVLSTATDSTIGRRRRGELNAELDTKTFKMSDLIVWRPNTENELRKKWDDQKQKLLESMSNASGSSEQFAKPKPPVSVPRVKLNEKGEIVIDQESLVVTESPENNVWDHVDDDVMPKKLNSMSFRKKIQRSSAWTDLETDMFYNVLSATGPDFGLMHEFIPCRTRAELKKKFSKEERENSWRVDETLRKPSLLSRDLFGKVKEMMKKIEAEKVARKEAKKKRKEVINDNNEDENNPEQDDNGDVIP
ncbi:unnamed protein product [Bursaphelenchus xylophilus]|uniref:(pine wood nematode) hypothetical protein n=1 Tax=Bursaphelenchus xylophilus TaxID=6326 RepID=A0A1I7S8U9_BURXY|nr:unnamed protein product [Bursaphelenchus xylophilus]CAG9085888.1 unnamed protein product [Bursaphelenchus xylophilus]